MAVRQHILPRFLLKGFASRINGNQVYTWVYPKAGNCYETNIINVAVGRNFYGREGDGSLDDKITDLENDFAPLLDSLRSSEGDQWVNNEGIVEFVTHLESRTKHLRDSFQIPSVHMAEEFNRNAANIENLEKVLLSDPSIMSDAFENQFNKLGVPNEYRPALKQLLMSMLPVMMKEKGSELVQVMETVFSSVIKSTPEMVKNAHVKALAKEPVPEWRLQRYKSLQWYIYNTKERLILGDAGTIWEVDSDKKFTSITFKADKIKFVYIPISDCRLLVGCSSRRKPEINTAVINFEISCLSREFFVCSEKNNVFADLANNIGDKAELISEDEMRKKVRDKFIN